MLPAKVRDPGLRAAWTVVLFSTPWIANALSNARHRREAVA
ncbi:MAG: hypothetical protein QNK04_20370 [Myxococcota bacterium]|nr:hypothetical protein [Myxococcota bacterium]